MPKILLYITAKIIWNFLFYNTDFHENRAHVHVGKRGMEFYVRFGWNPKWNWRNKATSLMLK